MEPRTLPGRRRSRTLATDAEVRPSRVDLTARALSDPARARSALAAASLGACAAGLLGADIGVVLIVAGVWTLRALDGADLSAAWGLACVGAAARWGTLGLFDVRVATKLAGPSVVAGTTVVRVGMCVAFLSALVSEASSGGFRSERVAQHAAAAAAAVALPPLFLVRGDGAGLAVWIVLAAGVTAASLVLAPYARRVPRWAPTTLAAAGVLATLVAR